ncbi:MAG: rhomboid family intramembrane serine protease [Bacteroidota bacterium]
MITILLILANLVVSLIAFSAFRQRRTDDRFLFIPAQVATGQNLKGMVLSHFSHADVGHLFFNMLTLYFFAPVVEQILGSFELLVIYCLSGVAATLLTFVMHRNNPRYRALGASGSVSGVILAAIVLYPSMSLYLFFLPIPIPGPVFAIGYIVISFFLARRQVGNIGHDAHIGGALAGLLLGAFLSPLGFGPLLQAFRELIP